MWKMIVIIAIMIQGSFYFADVITMRGCTYAGVAHLYTGDIKCSPVESQ